MGWYNTNQIYDEKCYFLHVVDMKYLVFLYFGTIITPALLLAAFYAHIYRVVLKQLRQIVTISPAHRPNGRSTGGGTMLRMLGAAQKREVKATQNLSIIVMFFMICWIPLYTINCIIAFCRDCNINETFMSLCIILSHANSAGNPILYAYHLKDFREAMKNFIFGMVGRNSASNGRPSYTFNNYNHYRHYSFRDSRLLHYSQNRRYVESPIYFNRTTKSMSLPTPPKLLSIVSNSVNLAAAPAVDNADIWRISEVPSLFENDSNNESSGIHTQQSTPPDKKHSSSSGSFKHCSYLNDINYDDDDDVFLDDTIPITEFTSENIHDNLSNTIKIIEQPEVLELKQKLSSSSPQLSKNVFLVESELIEIKGYDINSTIYQTKENGDINCKRRLKVSSGSSPSRSARVSPFRMFRKSSKCPRSSSLSDESTISPQGTTNSRMALAIRDNHSLGR